MRGVWRRTLAAHCWPCKQGGRCTQSGSAHDWLYQSTPFWSHQHDNYLGAGRDGTRRGEALHGRAVGRTGSAVSRCSLRGKHIGLHAQERGQLEPSQPRPEARHSRRACTSLSWLSFSRSVVRSRFSPSAMGAYRVERCGQGSTAGSLKHQMLQRLAWPAGSLPLVFPAAYEQFLPTPGREATCRDASELPVWHIAWPVLGLTGVPVGSSSPFRMRDPRNRMQASAPCTQQ